MCNIGNKFFGVIGDSYAISSLDNGLTWNVIELDQAIKPKKILPYTTNLFCLSNNLILKYDQDFKLIKEYKLEDKVFWMGEFSSDQIPSILKNASLLVLPRPPSKQAQGGFPTKLGEYLATSNPICATNVGEIPDYLIDGESVYFAEPGSIVSFANAMHRALSNPTVAKKVGANGKIVADKSFNKDIQAKILYDFLRENLQS